MLNGVERTERKLEWRNNWIEAFTECLMMMMRCDGRCLEILGFCFGLGGSHVDDASDKDLGFLGMQLHVVRDFTIRKLGIF